MSRISCCPTLQLSLYAYSHYLYTYTWDTGVLNSVALVQRLHQDYDRCVCFFVCLFCFMFCFVFVCMFVCFLSSFFKLAYTYWSPQSITTAQPKTKTNKQTKNRNVHSPYTLLCINPSSPKGGCPSNSFRPGAQNRTVKG